MNFVSSSCQLSFTAASSQPRQGARQLLDSSSARDRYLQPGWAPVFSGSRPVQTPLGQASPYSLLPLKHLMDYSQGRALLFRK